MFTQAIRQGVFPGASLVVGRHGKPRLVRCWGRTRYDGGSPVGPDTRFDLASLTKPLITTTLCMVAVSRGVLSPDTPLARLVPHRCLPASKTGITLSHLLSHSSGLPAYHPFYRDLISRPTAVRKAELLSRILAMPLLEEPGRHSHYSDLGFILLGLQLEELFEDRLDVLATRLILDPLDLRTLSFRRLQTGTDPTSRPVFEEPIGGLAFAPTEACPWRKRLLSGEIHDENGYCLDGVAGHAGLFGSADAIFRLLSHLVDVYRGVESRVGVKRDVLRLFWTRTDRAQAETWALGYDTPSSIGSSAGRRFSRHSVGHLGFTGTSFWIDLDREIIMVLLTNRVHPTRANDRIKAFRPLAHDLLMEYLHDD